MATLPIALALAGIPALASIITTAISGSKQRPPRVTNYPRSKGAFKKKAYVKKPTAYPAKRFGKGKGQYVVDKRPSGSYQHSFPKPVSNHSKSVIRLL